MPRRPREHELEDESVAAFKQCLPAAWIMRRLSHDYGIDAEVEIVRNQIVTGRRAFVQLKATDNGSVDTIRLDIAAVHYYRGLDVPVLVVLYIAPRNEIRATWFHEQDRVIPEQQKSLSVKLDVATVWDIATPERIENDIAAFRAFRFPGLPLPLSFALASHTDEILGEAVAEVERNLRTAAQEERGLINFDGHGSLGATVTLGPAMTRVSLGTVASVSFATSGLRADPSTLPFDVLTAVALVLEKVRQFDLATRLARRYASRSSIIGDGAVAVTVASAMREAHRPTDALELAEQIDRRGDELISMGSFYLRLVALQLDQSEEDAEAHRRFLEHQIGVATEEAVGFAHYNLANHLRGRNLPREAFHHYRLALLHRPSYADSVYWCREVAGVLFERGRYQIAARYYARAYEMGSDWPVRALYGDALMFSGRYTEALSLLAAAAADPEESRPVWILKSWFLQSLHDSGWLHDQERSPSRAVAAWSATHGSSTDLERKALHEGLRHDLVCGLTWFNLGVLENKTGNRPEALFAFIAAGLCEPWDVEAWMNALALAFTEGADPGLFQQIAAAAHIANGERLVEQLAVFARTQPAGFPVSAFINAFAALIRESADQPAQDDHELPQSDLPPEAAHVELALEALPTD